MNYPVFTRYRTPVGAFGRWMITEYDVPILLPGEMTDTVRVLPGDFIFGDYDGALVVPRDLTIEVMQECERIMGIEDRARAEFARGDDPVEVFQRHQRL
jgi:4-hydroxy-4-methyl-2-oxoglutarate aldolase